VFKRLRCRTFLALHCRNWHQGDTYVSTWLCRSSRFIGIWPRGGNKGNIKIGLHKFTRRSSLNVFQLPWKYFSYIINSDVLTLVFSLKMSIGEPSSWRGDAFIRHAKGDGSNPGLQNGNKSLPHCLILKKFSFIPFTPGVCLLQGILSAL
jgi:hypothetical protein